MCKADFEPVTFTLSEADYMQAACLHVRLSRRQRLKYAAIRGFIVVSALLQVYWGHTYILQFVC